MRGHGDHRAHTELTGGSARLGWYTGRDSPNTRRLVADTAASNTTATTTATTCRSGCRCAQPTAAGAAPGGALHAGLQRHALRAAAGLQHGDDFFTYLRDAFDVHYAEGDERPSMMSIGMHCRLLGRPGRIRRCSASSTTCSRARRVWITRRIDIARHWKQVHPFDAATAFTWE
jgi:allantoinase